MVWAASFIVAVGPMVIRGEDITASTFTFSGLRPTAITLLSRSLSVTMPTGSPSLSTIRLPTRRSPIILAASFMVASGEIVTTGVAIISLTR